MKELEAALKAQDVLVARIAELHEQVFALRAERDDVLEEIACWCDDEREMAIRACNLPRASAISDVAEKVRSKKRPALMSSVGHR